MTRLILWAANPILFALLVVLLIGLQTAVFSDYPLVLFQPNIVLLAVIWCALRRNFIEGGVLTLFFGYVQEIHSAAPQGAFLIIFMSVYLLLRLSAAVFVVSTQGPLIGLTATTTLLFKLVLLALFRSLGISPGSLQHHIVDVILSAGVNVIIGVTVFRWLDRFDWITYKNAKARQLMENDLYLSGEGL